MEEDEEVGEWGVNSTHSLSHLMDFSFKLNVFLCVTNKGMCGESGRKREREMVREGPRETERERERG